MMKNKKDSLLVSAKKQVADYVGEYYAAFGYKQIAGGHGRKDNFAADTRQGVCV